ncbi:single-strand binding protein/Primosomal replication protein n [Thalassoporum mexicanum PCC 7367]|uniref:single-stranded DNA-binding protein n=1 Tax=Thalassoporum mexicanum TaxID=3457544 RepID=UPI00029F966C|nr:single-stranded DNA-binding protein [Pseudanabaena sp. PCC 7367]AFY71057.1 single-strand binding protein/Primosomal replication protein n [Pseudanabaena sp. PCC 7367]
MNSFILMANVVTEPELRYTPDNQNSLATFLVQFPGGNRPEDQPIRLKVTGWNNLATEIMEKYHKGDQLVLEGRLGMNSIDRGAYKEKRAEMTASRIYAVGGSSDGDGYNASHDDYGSAAPAQVPTAAPPVANNPEYDDIPF